MQTTRDGSLPPVEVVWFRVPSGTPKYTGVTYFRSRNYLQYEEGQQDNYTPGEQNLEESDCSRSCRLPYYRGDYPAPYLSDGTVCGSSEVWRNGGTAADETLVTSSRGVAPCCQLFEEGFGGEEEGDPPVVVPVNVVVQAVPLWSGMQANATIGEIPVATESYLQFDVLQTANTWDTSGYVTVNENDYLTIPYDGYYQFTGTLYLQALPSSSPSPWQEIWQTYLIINGIAFPSEFDLAVYVLNFVPGGGPPPDVIGASLNFTAHYQCSKGDVVRLAVFLQQGHGRDYSIDDGYFAVTMLAAGTAAEGPTGICNQVAQISTTGTRPAACITNPTECVCPHQGPAYGLGFSFGVRYFPHTAVPFAIDYSYGYSYSGPKTYPSELDMAVALTDTFNAVYTPSSDPILTACCPDPVPQNLFATFTFAAGTCPCASTFTCELEWNPSNSAWEFGGPFGSCGLDIDVSLSCQGTDVSGWILNIGWQLGACDVVNVGANALFSSCSPFDLHFTGLSTTGTCCPGGVGAIAFTVEITP